MEEQTMLRILDKFIWYAERNRIFEAKRYVNQELDNIKGISEQNCKRRKLNKTYCKICKNRNCNLNDNPKYENNNNIDKSQVIAILQELNETLCSNNITLSLEKVNEYIKIIKDKTVLEILPRIKLLLDKEEVYEAKTYLLLELANFKDITPAICKNTIYPTFDYFCKTCTNYNCSSNKNKKDENSLS